MMEAQLLFAIVLTLAALIAGFVLFARCKCNTAQSGAARAREEEIAAQTGNQSETPEVKKKKHSKKPESPIKPSQHTAATTRIAEPQVGSRQDVFAISCLP